LPQGELLTDAIRYSLLGEAKRMRPVLCMSTAEALGLPAETVRGFSLALELLHTSSLIHDDLPALDDDEFRRGKPSCHKKFGEAAAILTGDQLLVDAFSSLARYAPASSSALKDWPLLFAEAGQALCRGQVLDLILARKIALRSAEDSQADLENICRQKTAALFRAAVLAPLSCIAGSGELFAALEAYGGELGLLFQISDDLLDETHAKALPTNSYVERYGREQAGRLADDCVKRGEKALACGGASFWFLRELLSVVRARSS